MLEDTLGKFVLVIALFAVFVVLGNIFAASRQAASGRASTLRRHGRRRRARSLPAAESVVEGEDEAESPGDGPPVEDEPSLARRMLPQLALSAVALGVAVLALVVMWRVARGG